MDEKRRVLSIDLETFSDIDLSSCGVYRYVEGDFHILLFAYAFDDEDVRVVDMACGEERLALPDRWFFHPLREWKKRQKTGLM